MLQDPEKALSLTRRSPMLDRIDAEAKASERALLVENIIETIALLVLFALVTWRFGR